MPKSENKLAKQAAEMQAKAARADLKGQDEKANQLYHKAAVLLMKSRGR